MSSDSEIPSNTTTPIGAYGAYPFSSDETYQVSILFIKESKESSPHRSRKQGLASILAGGTLDANSPPEVREELERRTRVFYFNK